VVAVKWRKQMTDESSDRTPSRRGVLQGLVGLGTLGLTGLSTTAADSSIGASSIGTLQQSGISIKSLAYNNGYGYTISDGEILKFDIDTGETVNTIDAPDGSDRGLAYGDGSSSCERHKTFTSSLRTIFDLKIIRECVRIHR
jgi:hypothetical protein